MDNTPLRIGLTGGIACGKTTVSNLFADLGVPIIDADTIAHGLTQPGQPVLAAIIDAFGHAFMTASGQLNRGLLRQTVLNNVEKRQQLEALLHPQVYANIEEQAQGLTSAYCVLSIPLLLETQQWHRVQRILVVDCCNSVQCRRLLARGLSATEIQGFISAQVSRQERLRIANDIIPNTQTGLEQLKHTILALHNKYIKLSARRDK